MDGLDNGIPSILGWDADLFAKTLEFYRTGERANPVMVSVAQSLDLDAGPRSCRLLRIAAEAGEEVRRVERSGVPTRERPTIPPLPGSPRAWRTCRR